MAEKKHHYTIMIIPHSERETVTFKIPVFMAQFIVILIVAGLLIFMIWLKQYIQLQSQYDQTKSARVELETMKKEYNQLVGELLSIEKQVINLQELEQQIRLQNGFDPSISYYENIELSTAIEDISKERKNGVRASSLLIESATQELGNLSAGIPGQIDNLEDLVLQIEKKNYEIAHIPTILPTIGRVTSDFGIRRDPINNRKKMHHGVDIANRYNTPIYATADGIVISSARNGAYGREIKINHQNGIVTVYGHLNKMLVIAGEEVKKGQLIAYMGSSGRSTGPHLHYEVRIDGVTVDPMDYIQ